MYDVYGTRLPQCRHSFLIPLRHTKGGGIDWYLLIVSASLQLRFLYALGLFGQFIGQAWLELVAFMIDMINRLVNVIDWRWIKHRTSISNTFLWDTQNVSLCKYIQTNHTIAYEMEQIPNKSFRKFKFAQNIHWIWKYFLKFCTEYCRMYIVQWFVRARHLRDLLMFELKIDRYFVTATAFQNYMNILHPISDLTALWLNELPRAP